MSKSEDNTNELESYGVWVKNTTSNEPSQLDTQSDDVDVIPEDMGLDLPDFDDTDFSDMFKDDSQFSTSEEDSFGEDSDTTLSTDELANITDAGEVAIENIETPINETFDEGAEPIFDQSFDDMVENLDDSIETVDTEDAVVTEETSDTAETLDEIEPLEAGSEEEISLDDFMDEGFSDESVASGNNGYEPGAEQNVDTVAVEDSEELSLDDFLDGDSFESEPVEKVETVEEEAPIDMDISFDDSVDSVETETNLSIDNDIDEIEEDEELDMEDIGDTEEISLDDFGITEEEPAVTSESSDTSVPVEEMSFDTEEIDLSDFGIDEAAEETPIVQDVETQKNKEKVVDYDLFIGNETTSSAPEVNELKTPEPEKVEEPEVQEAVQPVVEAPANTTPVDNSLLQQIVSDLSSLKDEINNLKTNIAEIKANEAAAAELPTESEELDIPEEEDQGGFFSLDDTDDTIALSGDELSNIMNNADFSETDAPDLSEATETIEEIEEPEPDVISEDVFDNSIDETAISDESELTDDNIELPSDDSEVTDENLNFEYDDEKLEEPTFDNLEIDEPEEEMEDIPEEIDIAKDDNDIFVESTSSDFMDTVKDTTEDMEPASELESVDEMETVEELDDVPTVEEVLDNDAEDEVEIPSVIDIEQSLSEDTTEESVDTAEIEDISFDDEIPTVDKLLNTPAEENITEDFSPSITDEETEALTSLTEDEMPAEEEIIEEESPSIDDFSSVDNLDSDLSSSNIDYLTKKEEEPTAAPETNNNTDLKQEIKSVLLYMDQLLENLPEDKIYEFAKSDEFATYKKLFKDLGLS